MDLPNIKRVKTISSPLEIIKHNIQGHNVIQSIEHVSPKEQIE